MNPYFNVVSHSTFLSFLQTCTESVTSVQGGVVSTPGYDEIICSTYAGM